MQYGGITINMIGDKGQLLFCITYVLLTQWSQKNLI